jgi:LPXTG-site transpeptidase (sortase) family protein
VPDRPRRLGLAAAGLALAAAGAAAWWQQGAGATAHDPSSAGAAASQPAAATAPAAQVVRVRHQPGAPVRVRIPALHVDAPVLAVRAPDRTLVPPSDPQELGWWVDGAKPGAARGSALITGHTVHTGGGALDDLERLRRGDLVVVRTHRGALRYDVTRVRIFSKGTIAQDAARLFSQRVAGRLVLVTCEDWDGERYLSNVVVTATPRG